MYKMSGRRAGEEARSARSEIIYITQCAWDRNPIFIRTYQPPTSFVCYFFILIESRAHESKYRKNRIATWARKYKNVSN